MVDLVPGSSTTSASPGSGWPGCTSTSVTPGSCRSGSRSSKLAMRARTGTAIFTGPLPRPSSRPSASSAGSSPAFANHGTTPAEAQPVRRTISARPSSNSDGSPRKRLMKKARMRACSSGSSTAWVPTSAAITPPRSISPHRSTGRSAACAKPMLAMSPWRRLISAGLPAPSTSTRSASCDRRAKLSSTFGSSSALREPYSRARMVPKRRPCTITCAPVSVSGFSSTGFMCTVAGMRQAMACNACARPISPPSTVTAALFDMFCGLKGATVRP